MDGITNQGGHLVKQILKSTGEKEKKNSYEQNNK